MHCIPPSVPIYTVANLFLTFNTLFLVALHGLLWFPKNITVFAVKEGWWISTTSESYLFSSTTCLTAQGPLSPSSISAIDRCNGERAQQVKLILFLHLPVQMHAEQIEVGGHFFLCRANLPRFLLHTTKSSWHTSNLHKSNTIKYTNMVSNISIVSKWYTRIIIASCLFLYMVSSEKTKQRKVGEKISFEFHR